MNNNFKLLILSVILLGFGFSMILLMNITIKTFSRLF